jgi:membrane-bound lytic murein transglycosylase D
MKIPWTFVAILFTSMVMANPISETVVKNKNVATEKIWNASTATVVSERLYNLDLPFSFEMNDQVLLHVKRYVANGYRDTEAILGRSTFFFPIFEHFLGKYQLPESLKYLPMIESGLLPTINSHVGAGGLWQFMPSTARFYGLRVDEYVDERYDPYKATEAAVKLLGDLYGQFGDWSLVLAAYNCGPGRVANAIRLSGNPTFDGLKGYLPDQTQDYLPRYVAAAYVANYYASHELTPRVPSYLQGETRTLYVNHYVSFRDIARSAGLDMNTIALLNPSFLGYAVPESKKGNYLILPSTAIDHVRTFMDSKAGNAVVAPQNTFRTTYTVNKEDDLNRLAKLFQCSVEDIVEWNKLNESKVVIKQEIILYLTKSFMLNRA